MGGGEILHMNVVPNAGAVGRVVIGAKNRNETPFTARGLTRDFDEVCGLGHTPHQSRV